MFFSPYGGLFLYLGGGELFSACGGRGAFWIPLRYENFCERPCLVKHNMVSFKVLWCSSLFAI